MNVIYIFVELIDIKLKCMFYIAGKFQTDAGSGWFINFSRFEIFSTFLVLILLRVTWIQLYRKYPSENDLNTAIRCIEYRNTALQAINGFQVPASHCSHSLPRAATDSDLQIMEILILLCTHPGPQIRDTRSGCQGQLGRFLIPRLFNSILCNAMPFIWGTASQNYDISISISFLAIQVWAQAGAQILKFCTVHGTVDLTMDLSDGQIRPSSMPCHFSEAENQTYRSQNCIMWMPPIHFEKLRSTPVLSKPHSISMYHSLASFTLAIKCSEQIIIRPNKTELECYARYKTPLRMRSSDQKETKLVVWNMGRGKSLRYCTPVPDEGKAICNNWDEMSF